MASCATWPATAPSSYGPNTNIVVNGSIIFFSECAVNYILGCLRLLVTEGYRTIDCRAEAHNERGDAGNALMARGASTVNTWYRNELGRISQNRPFTLLEYWQRTHRPDPADFHLRP